MLIALEFKRSVLKMVAAGALVIGSKTVQLLLALARKFIEHGNIGGVETESAKRACF